jgi:hypothetical protein
LCRQNLTSFGLSASGRKTSPARPRFAISALESNADPRLASRKVEVAHVEPHDLCEA